MTNHNDSPYQVVVKFHYMSGKAILYAYETRICLYYVPSKPKSIFEQIVLTTHDYEKAVLCEELMWAYRFKLCQSSLDVISADTYIAKVESKLGMTYADLVESE